MPSVKKYKICRRMGTGMFEKCQTQRFSVSEARRSTKGNRGARLSDYGQQLIEKQKVRMTYGVSEKQFQNYVKKAILTAHPAQSLFSFLESRLDNIVFRMGMAPTRRMARQLTTHGHIMINTKRVDVPSAVPAQGDTIRIRKGSTKLAPFADLEEKLKQYKTPQWLTFDAKTGEGKITGAPSQPDPFLNFETVIGFYTR